MTHEELGKTIHAARCVMDGTFATQLEAADKLHLAPHVGKRISEATTVLRWGSPEIIAAMEAGRLPLQTATMMVRKNRDHGDQNAILYRLETEGHHGIWKGNRPGRQNRRLAATRKNRRELEAIDKLLDAVSERIDVLLMLSQSVRPAPDAPMGRRWRTTLRSIRDRVAEFHRRVDWTQTNDAATAPVAETQPPVEGEDHDHQE